MDTSKSSGVSGTGDSIDDFFTNHLIPAGIARQKALAHLRAMQEGKFLGTGIEALDKRIRLVPQELIYIGGRAASGKTALGLQIVSNALKTIMAHGEKSRVALFSAEMSAAALLMREAAALTRIPVDSLTLGTATADEYNTVSGALKNSDNLGHELLYIDESPAPTLEHMVSELDALRIASPVRLVVFDYLELAGEFGHSQPERIGKISRGLKAIAKAFDCPVLALAQLNRDIEKRADKKVMLSDFMYGGEQAADIAIGLLRPHTYDESKPSQLVEAHIVKYRNGRTGKEDLAFDEKTMRFSTGVFTRTYFNEESSSKAAD